jgi:hypothetical protein
MRHPEWLRCERAPDGSDSAGADSSPMSPPITPPANIDPM